MKRGIVIANTGSPTAPTPQAVQDYLRRFLSDSHICPMNPKIWSFILEKFIIPKRSAASSKRYASIWTNEGAPINVIMNSLARKLESACEQDGVACVRYATSYSSPSIKDALVACRNRGCDSVVVVPLYPQSALSTTMVVHDKSQEALASLKWEVDASFVECYWNSSVYIEAIANSIRHAGFNPASGDRLLFAFHSIPLSDIRAGDTYDEQTRCTAQNVAAALHLDDSFWRIGYQCRFDKARSWLSPFASMVLKELADAERIYVIAPNFSIDCLETLYDIQQELRDSWIELIGSRTDLSRDSFRYIPCLNDSDAHVEVLRHIILNGERVSPLYPAL